jgi:hypothetical protein
VTVVADRDKPGGKGIASVKSWPRGPTRQARTPHDHREHRRQLRYCDTGDVAPNVPGLRVAMLGELLGITVWQAGEPGRPEPLSRDRAGADIFVR